MRMTGQTTDDVIFRLDERPRAWAALVGAIQHATAVFVGIITPPLLISQALGLELHDSVHIVGMSLAVSGIATFIQCRRIGPVGSGLRPGRHRPQHRAAEVGLSRGPNR